MLRQPSAFLSSVIAILLAFSFAVHRISAQENVGEEGSLGAPRSNLESVERWGVFEVTLEGPSDGNPFVDVKLSARFKQGNHMFEPQGFYDGNGIYRVRFMPDTLGTWEYITKSNIPELDGKTGKFICVAPSADNHGPVQVYNTFYFQYADGTPYHPYGTTCYAWVHQSDAMEEQTLSTLSTTPFNKMRMCIFPKAYSYNKNEPVYYPFEGEPLKDWDFTRFNPEFWKHFEQRVLDLQKLGVEADIILFHTYDRWGFEEMNSDSDDRYIRYAVARLAAFRNVWWSLANEYDLMPAKSDADWDRFFEIIRAKDPYKHLRGIHNAGRWYDHTKPWVTHCSLQTSNMAAGIRYRQTYQKPVIYDECRYEGNIRQRWGSLTALEMTQRFWQGTLSGCYVGHGETYEHPQDLLWWAKGGVLGGQSPERIAFLKGFMADAPPFEGMAPLGDDKGHYILAKSGEYYLAHSADSDGITLTLQGEQPYRIDGIDIWEMKEVAIGTAYPGQYALSSPRPDYVYRFTLYEPGEKLRPEADASADATRGTVPLKVTFAAAGDLIHHWNFADGTTSDRSNPTHIYQRPGQYNVTLTVTDADGLSSSTGLPISVLPSPPDDLGKQTSWPGSHTGLVFLWSRDRKRNEILDKDGEVARICRVEPRGAARLDDSGAMQTEGGAFLASDVDDALLEACKRSNQLTIEAVVTINTLEQRGPARIITFSRDTGNRNFTLGQEGENLVLRLRTPQTGNNALNPQLRLSKISAHQPIHVIVSYFPGHVFCYVDGETVYSGRGIQGDFSNWERHHLLFGDEFSGRRNWRGALGRVALYNRFVGPEEAKLKYGLWRKF
jgi:hypothetical protein